MPIAIVLSFLLFSAQTADDEIAQLLRLLHSPDISAYQSALKSAAEIEHPDFVRRLGAEISKLEPKRQVDAIRLLSERKDIAFLPSSILKLAKTGEPETRKAAFEAMSKHGHSGCIPVLLETIFAPAGDQKDEKSRLLMNSVKKTAKSVLDKMDGDEYNTAIVIELRNEEPSVRKAVLELIRTRNIVSAFEDVIGILEVSDEDFVVRHEAIQTLAKIVDISTIPDFVRILDAAPAQERESIKKALRSAVLAMPDKNVAARKLLIGLDGAKTETKCAVLEILHILGGSTAAAVLKAAAQDDNPAIRKSLHENVSIENASCSVRWHENTKTVAIADKTGVFARLSFQDSSVSKTEKQLIISGILLPEKDLCEFRFSLPASDELPFVLINARSKEKRKTDVFSYELTFAEKMEQLVSLGTAGLKSVDGHKGSYSFLAIAEPKSRRGIVCGWLSHKIGSGSVHSSVSDKGNVLLKSVIEYGKPNIAGSTDIFAIGRFDDCLDGLEKYAEAVAIINNIKIKTIPAAGYCTWYAEKFGGACNEKKILELTQAAAEKLAPYGFNFVQIDDKWQLGISNNGPKKNFTQTNPTGPYPNGMKPTVDFIRSQKMLAGIWFMPFAGSVTDPHFPKNWFVKSGRTDIVNEQGKSSRRYNAIANKIGEPYESYWGGTSLDMTNPDVQKYLESEVRRIYSDWGFNYFKLDGIWTGMACDQLYVNNEFMQDDFGESVFFDETITPMQAYRKGYEIIREAAPDVFILGCNVSQNMRTLGGSFGLVDAMRVGPDNGSAWDRLKRGPWAGSNRYFFNARVWHNDPDPVYVRASMPLEQARLIASWVSISGQLYAFSDWLPDLPQERVEILQRTMPSHGLKTARPIDLFEDDLPKIWHVWDESTGVRRDVIALYNWDEKKPITIEATPQKLGLPSASEYAVFDFWEDAFVGVFSGALSIDVPPSSCRILAIRPVLEHPFVLSTSRHVTQGIVDILEEKWDANTKSLCGKSRVVAETPYEMRFFVPEYYKAGREPIIRLEFKPNSNVLDWQLSIKSRD